MLKQTPKLATLSHKNAMHAQKEGIELENARSGHHIPELLERYSGTDPRTTVRFLNHVPQQVIADTVLLQLAGDATEVVQGDGSIGAAREEAVGGVYFLGEGVLAAHVQLCGGDGEERCVGDEAGRGGIDGGDDG